MSRQQRGFTLVELVVVMPAMFIVAAFLSAFLVTLYQNILLKNGELELNIEAQNTLFNLRDDIFFANRFAGEIQPDTTDTHAPSGGWNAITNNALVVYEAAFNKNRQAADRQLVFKQDAPYPCNDANVTQNQFSTNTMIYFVQNGTLYKRTLVPNQAENCLTTFRRQSCPQANSSASCPSDVILAKNVQSISYAFYDRNGAVMSSATLQSDLDTFIQAQRADINLQLQKMVAGEEITGSATISIKKTE